MHDYPTVNKRTNKHVPDSSRARRSFVPVTWARWCFLTAPSDCWRKCWRARLSWAAAAVAAAVAHRRWSALVHCRAAQSDSNLATQQKHTRHHGGLEQVDSQGTPGMCMFTYMSAQWCPEWPLRLTHLYLQTSTVYSYICDNRQCYASLLTMPWPFSPLHDTRFNTKPNRELERCTTAS